MVRTHGAPHPPLAGTAFVGRGPAGWGGRSLRGSPLTPVRKLLVVAVFPLVGQRVQVVATATFPNHVLLEAGANTGLGGGKGQREGRLEGDVPTSAQGDGAHGAAFPGLGMGRGREKADLKVMSPPPPRGPGPRALDAQARGWGS